MRPLAVAVSIACCIAFVAGCATPEAPPAATVETAPVTVVCLPLKTYTPAQEKAVSDELVKLPDNDPLVGFIADYGALRAADRACQSGQK